MEDFIYSIVKKLCGISGIETVYFDAVDENFASPSIYVPPMEQASHGDTMNTFRFSNALYVKVFAKETREAMVFAGLIVARLAAVKNRIELLDEDGNATGNRFRLKSVTCKSVENSVAQIYIQFDTAHAYLQPDYEKIMTFNWGNSIK